MGAGVGPGPRGRATRSSSSSPCCCSVRGPAVGEVGAASPAQCCQPDHPDHVEHIDIDGSVSKVICVPQLGLIINRFLGVITISVELRIGSYASLL